MRIFLRFALFALLLPMSAAYAGKQLDHIVKLPNESISEGVHGFQRWIGEQLLEADIHAEFSAKALKEVAQFEHTGLDLESLEEWSHIPFVTIDNDDSKDLDQAVAIEKDLENNTYQLHYAIADTAYFLKPGSALEAEAKKRCLTSYLPDRNVPVMPRQLSEGLCSLNPEVYRRAIIVSIHLDENGRQLSKSFHHGSILSRAQLSYRLVQEYYDAPESSALNHQEYTPVLDFLKELGPKLIDLAIQRGVFQRENAEVVTLVQEDGLTCALSHRYRVEAYNEQISIISNRAAAEFIREHNVPTIHRFHEELSQSKKKDLRRTLSNIGRPWRGTLAEYVSTLDTSKPKDDAALQNIYRSFERAIYDSIQSGHFGLRLKDYDHFTAPMRRYGDTIVHKAILSIIEADNKEHRVSERQAHDIAEAMTNASNRERLLANSIKRKVAALFLTPHEGQILNGYIQFQAARGMSIHLDDMPFDVWIPQKKKRYKKGEARPPKYKTGVPYQFRIVDVSNPKSLKIEVVE